MIVWYPALPSLWISAPSSYVFGCISGISTHIEKAFLHVFLKERDKDFTRFLWLSDPLDPTSEFLVYHFRRVLFGAVSSPFILSATLHHHLQQHNTPLSRNIQSNLYVDNVVSGCETGVQAIQFYHEARSMLNSAGFSLRAWASNCKSLNRKAQEDGVASSSQWTRILALQWNTAMDQLSLMPRSLGGTAGKLLTTKCDVLMDASKVFNPFVIASPVSARAKLFMQKHWKLHVEWDESVDAALRDEWTAIYFQTSYSYTNCSRLCFRFSKAINQSQ